MLVLECGTAKSDTCVMHTSVTAWKYTTHIACQGDLDEFLQQKVLFSCTTAVRTCSGAHHGYYA